MQGLPGSARHTGQAIDQGQREPATVQPPHHSHLSRGGASALRRVEADIPAPPDLGQPGAHHWLLIVICGAAGALILAVGLSHSSIVRA